jgi:hypothetical protein
MPKCRCYVQMWAGEVGTIACVRSHGGARGLLDVFPWLHGITCVLLHVEGRVGTAAAVSEGLDWLRSNTWYSRGPSGARVLRTLPG